MATTKDVLRHTLAMADRITKKYVEDLSDADLKLSPIDGMNPMGWQLGHLITTEQYFANVMQPNSAPALPKGFADNHRREAPGNPDGYVGVKDYLSLMEAQRANTLKILDAMTDEQLAAATTDDRLKQMCPTAASIFNLIGLHYMMHAGQWVAVRRSLGKPIAI